VEENICSDIPVLTGSSDEIYKSHFGIVRFLADIRNGRLHE